MGLPLRREESPFGRLCLDYIFLILAALAILAMLQNSLNHSMPLPFLGLGPITFFLNLWLILTPMVLWSLFFEPRPLVIVAMGTAAGFAIINSKKVSVLGQPINFFDLRFDSMPNILWKYTEWREYLGAFLLLSIPLYLVFLLFRKKEQSSQIDSFFHVRLWSSVFLAIVAIILFVEPLRNNSRLQKIYPPHPDRLEMSRDYGYVLGSVMNLRYISLFHTYHYSKKNVEDILQDAKTTPAGVTPTSDKKNVVLILLESFHDYNLDGLRFRKDVMPFYHQLKKEMSVGTYYSPVVGGGTANVEYEVLTGLSAAFLPNDTFAYEQSITHAMPSVVGVFKKNGYETLAIHNGYPKIYNRTKVYSWLGFDQFITLPNMRRDPSLTAPYGDDQVFAKSLAALRDSSQAQFQFLITIDTHGPYEGEAKQRWMKTEIESPLVSRMNVYGDRVYKLDQNLENYFKELKKLKNPPTVILFGDHHPAMSIELLFEPDSARHLVEATVWNGGPRVSKPLGNKVMSCLSPTVLHAANLPLPAFYRYLENFCQKTEFSEPIRVTTENANTLSNYEILCYDRLFGKQYSGD